MNQALTRMEKVRASGLATGLDITPWLTDRHHASAVWRDGREIESAFTWSQLFRMSVVDDEDRLRTVCGTSLPEPDDVIGLVRKLPSWQATTSDIPRTGRLPGPVQQDDSRTDRGSLNTLARALSRPVSGRTIEVRIEDFRDVVTAVLPHSSAGYTTGRYALQIRVTSTRAARASRETWVHAGDWEELVSVAEFRRDELLRHTGLSTTDDAPRSGAEVLVHGEVAAQLLALAAKAFSAEAVLSGRSPYAADSLGEPVAHSSIDIVDDAGLAGGSRWAAFDDEGVPCHRVALVAAGSLRAFLGSSSTRALPGSSSGCTWSPDRMSPPRPAGSNIFLSAPSDHAIDEPVIHRVVECQGLHMSNDITGDFAMSTSLQVGHGTLNRRMEQVMLSGNVFQLLKSAVPASRALSWFAGSSTHYGSPDLVVRGLQVAA